VWINIKRKELKKTLKKVLTKELWHDILIHVLSERAKQTASKEGIRFTR